jgi:hypothetical protein
MQRLVEAKQIPVVQQAMMIEKDQTASTSHLDQEEEPTWIQTQTQDSSEAMDEETQKEIQINSLGTINLQTDLDLYER